MLGAAPPLLLGFGVMMWAIFRQQHRHEEAMQVDRLRADQVRRSRYRVIQGGQGDGRGGGGARVLEILGRPGGDLGRRRVLLRVQVMARDFVAEWALAEGAGGRWRLGHMIALPFILIDRAASARSSLRRERAVFQGVRW
jgi:hypothetical protein